MSQWAPPRTSAPRDPQPDGPTPLSRRAKLLWAAVIVVAAVGLTGWNVVAAHLRSEVRVTLAEPVQCTGTTVSYQPPGLPLGVGTPVISLQRGLQCTLTVRVTNAGPLPVHIDSTSFDYLGPGGLEVTGSKVHTARSGLATQGVDREIGAHGAITVSYHLVMARHACYDAGTSSWTQHLPTVHLSSLHLSGQQTGDVSLALLGTSESACHGNR